MKNWIKLEQGNDWGVIYYTLPGKRRTDGSSDRRQGISFRVGMQLDVRTPDGHEEKRTLDVRRQQVYVSDHGARYPVTQDCYGFVVRAHGIDVFVPITSFEVLEEQMPAARMR